MDNFQTEIDLEQLDSELKYFVYKWTKGENSGAVCEYDRIFKEPTTGIIWVNFKDGSRINHILLDEFMLRMEPSQLQQNKIATVIAIDGCSKFQKQLLNLGIHKDKKIRMVASQLFSGPLTIEIDGKQISIGRGMASKIIIA